MALNQLVFLTDGTSASLAALPDVGRLADALDYRLAVLHLLDETGDSRGGDGRIAAALAALPNPSGVLAVPEANLNPSLATLAGATGGMVVLLPTRRGPISRILVGNDYERLLREGPLPVLALPASGRVPPIRQVLFPADFSPRSERHFDETVELCRTLGAELHVLHVYGADGLLPYEQDLTRRAAVTVVRDLLTIDEERLAALMSRASARGVPVRSKTAEGRAHAATLAYAAANAIDLIVMPSHGTRTSEDVFFGTTTVRVIQKADVPVLALRA
ncbi:MAG: universal stress protein [Kouleothrix sp.]|nr:universal stress protein [Kouleothrix sp.]